VGHAVSHAPRVLLVDDETGILESLQILFRGAGYSVRVAGTGRDALQAIDAERPDLVVSDIRMPGVSGLEVLARARARDPETPVVLMTGQASLQSAMRAVNDGAYHYLQKPFANEELLAVCARALRGWRPRIESGAIGKDARPPERRGVARPTGASRCFLEVLALAETVAPTDATLLIGGESGTGKEVLARYVHDLSGRAQGTFLSINCGALPEGLLESELFGHVKGAFTGAVRDREGLLVAARGGTFFLDEVGEMSPATQVKLLRAIQEREVMPVGSTERVALDVRIIAATNRQLEEEVRLGRFRSDLYYRLNVIALQLPPLRERREDVPLLAAHFLERLGAPDGGAPRTLSDEALSVLMRYDWPGNVRELENALERAVIMSRGAVIGPEALPARVRAAPTARLVCAGRPANPSLEIIERAYILWVLQAEGGNRSRAAEVLGIDPSTLYRKLNKYGIDV